MKREEFCCIRRCLLTPARAGARCSKLGSQAKPNPQAKKKKMVWTTCSATLAARTGAAAAATTVTVKARLQAEAGVSRRVGEQQQGGVIWVMVSRCTMDGWLCR